MQIIGFNFTKISAERSSEFKKAAISTDIEFKNVEKEKLEILKDGDAFKVTFRYVLIYGENKKKEDESKVEFEGFIILSATKDEAKQIQKQWKKKELSNAFKVPLFNIILRKCSTKALQLQEDVNLPTHIPLPKIQPKKE